jgi:hypothetical protein
MKLINPTDKELNIAFTEHVAKLIPCDEWKHFMHDKMMRGNCGHDNCYPRNLVIQFTHYADAVLPYLDQVNYRAHICPVSGNTHHHHIVEIYTWHTEEKLGEAYADTFARAATLALLRANGVEIENEKIY